MLLSVKRAESTPAGEKDVVGEIFSFVLMEILLVELIPLLYRTNMLLLKDVSCGDKGHYFILHKSCKYEV